MRKRSQARECVLKILYEVDVTQCTLDDALTSVWELSPSSDEIRDFAERIARGTLEHLDEIDRKITQYAENWQMDRMAAVDRNILRFAVYELIFMDDIPPKVSINEAVNIAKKYSQEESGKFVNGVLDKIHHTEAKAKSQAAPDPESTG
jgi:transcription antitermination factor NusB